jgi:hypothetical protein
MDVRPAVLALAALSLGACATATPYQPAVTTNQIQGAQGFSEERLDSDRFRVSFQGNSITDRTTVENYLLYRAAELTLQNGYDHFVLTARATDENSRLVPIGGTGFRSSFYAWDYFHPRFGWRPYGWRSFGYDPFFDDPIYVERTRFRASAEVVMRRGPKPEGDVSAFSARDVQTNLASAIQRPQPR